MFNTHLVNWLVVQLDLFNWPCWIDCCLADRPPIIACHCQNCMLHITPGIRLPKARQNLFLGQNLLNKIKLRSLIHYVYWYQGNIGPPLNFWAPSRYHYLQNCLVLLVLKLTSLNVLYSKTFYLNIFENTFIVKYGRQNLHLSLSLI